MEDLKEIIPVIIESPLGTDEDGNRVAKDEMRANKYYALKCMRDSLMRGEAPFASHLLYTQVLDDEDPEERKIGMDAGFAIGRSFKWAIIYTDRGISSGMVAGIKRHRRNGLIVEERLSRVFGVNFWPTIFWCNVIALVLASISEWLGWL